MNKRQLFLLFVFFIMLNGLKLSFVFGQHIDSTERAKSPAAAGNTKRLVAVPPGWLRFSPPSTAFTVVLPKEPTIEVSKSSISDSVQITTNSYTAANDHGVFVVAYVKDLPLEGAKISESFRQTFYDGMWKGMAEGIRVELEKNGLNFKVDAVGGLRKLVINSYDGREQDFTIGPLQGRAQMILGGQHAYILVTVLANDNANPFRDAFFNSFQIKTK